MKRQSTMPTPPSPKKPGFFKRTFTHRRRSSSVTFTHPPRRESVPQVESEAHPDQEPDAQPQVQSQESSEKSMPREDSKFETPSLSSSEVSKPSTAAEEGSEVSRQDSRGSRIKWAEGYDESTKARPRRPSSGSRRRPSIFHNSEDHVEAGAGSKARRLSTAVPSQGFQVDECALETHFSFVDRHKKKNIGEGGAAMVNLMHSKTVSEGKSPSKVFAVKEFRERDDSEETEHEYQRKIMSEFAIAKSLEHPNIVQTYNLCYSHNRTKWYHVMEYCDQGDINDIVNLKYFSMEDRNCMFKQLIRGVDYMHSHGIAHRDLKSENLLLSSTGCLKIADFGTSEVFSGPHPGLRRCRRPSLVDQEKEIKPCQPGLVGSRPYMAPEIIARQYPYDPRAADIWSCGVLYISLLVGGTPWDAADTSVKNFNIYLNSWEEYHHKMGDEAMPTKEGPFPSFVYTPQWKTFANGELWALVLGMLHPDPKQRISAHDALESQTVTEFACCQQDGYSDDIKTRQRKARHNHQPPKGKKGLTKSH